MKINDDVLLGEIESARNNLKTDRLDMSFGEIISMYERDEIIINPEFQRFYRWTDYQKSRFLESVILGIPVPPIFVAEDTNGRWELVDGLQRLSSILSFFGILKTIPEKNNWQLESGDIVKSLEGFSQVDLPMKIQLNIKRATCRVEIIKWDSVYDMRYELFNRLNTGGTPLTDQEIRNCIYRGVSSKFNDFLKKLASNSKFIMLVDATQQQVSELYLEELVLRFLSMTHNVKNISLSMGQHMSEFMRDAVMNENFNYQKYESIFNQTVNILHPCGKKIFRSSNNVFATGFYDTIMIGIAENLHIYSGVSPKIIQNKVINEVKNDIVIRKISRSGGNNSVQRVRNRIKEANRIFGNR
ncbi:DUF262 domain-containing protein [Maribellus sp. YY47]|uniref:DUF262 domain-containing protein n=1 Tax=Maribellus sp. YY47 TaxID=2929486 RepID=UPI0020005CF3|nr:DUF262 domain-containing protein [Maribellus sp. YY47]MCK3684617.1 DUF262 domain-containing protein [Maribellus sp. YY47]